jgi:uncharacterized protein YjbI with pentapeptide repeats
VSEIKPENIIAVDLVRPRRIAQTTREMAFALSLRPCGTCGEFQRDPMQFRSTGPAYDETREHVQYWTECLCPGCGSKRQLVSWTVPNPSVGSLRFHLIGAVHSQIIEPWQFMSELDRLGPMLHSTPADLSWQPYRVSLRALERALTCAIELRKFVVPGQSDLLESEYTDAGRAHRAAHPDRYTATTVQASHDFLTALYETHMVEIPRIVKESEAAAGPPKIRVGDLNRDTIRAHNEWLARGKVGSGQLGLAHQRFRDKTLYGNTLLDIRFEHVVFEKTNLNYTSFDKSELFTVEFIECALQSAKFITSSVEHSTFAGCNINLADFARASISDCLVRDSELARSNWKDAKVKRSSFERVLFHDAILNDVEMRACNLRGNFIGATKQFGDLATTVGARFEDCDFRETGWHGRDLSGATFVRCQFAGSGGSPRAHVGLVLDDCDMSREEFLAMLAAADAAQAKRPAGSGDPGPG